MPTVKLLATVDDKEVRGAKVSDGKNVWDIPVVLSLGRGGNYALKISYKASGGLEYFGELQIAATWTGERVYRIALAAKLPVTDALRKEPQTQSAKELILDLGKKVTMKMVLIPAGKFMMGSPEGEEGRFNNEGPQHEVVISKPFYMAIWEVTQEQYEQIMGKNPSKFQCKANPVEMVSWEEATEFCKKVSAKTGKTVRLPTEAEWEHACRAGSKTRFGFGDDDDLGDYAWYKNNSDSKPHTVAQKKANNWGLYDMHGNLWEWCSDWYADSYANASKSDPTGPACGSYRVLRGGCWSNSPQGCRSALRGGGSPVNRCDVSGFRVVVVGVVDVD